MPSTQTTRTVIILQDHKDYPKWIELKKTAALKYDIWRYCDPSINRANLELLRMLVRPKPSDVRTTLEEGESQVTLATLSTNEREFFRIIMEDYMRERKTYDKQVEALADLRSQIQETVHADNLRYTFNCDTAYDMLSKLKARFAPSDREKQQEVIAQWKKLCKQSAKNQDLDAWLDK
jgi:hypothetical protein